ncbi:hypothetical protein CRM22_009821 [Opisthorchis felineus]|uniref:Protein XRP2 n=1 Tax=Opisthorchis felineus TaxID=147828 RepID=A0A4S2L4T6_OPIFE|nr:hypothetical protein CRM22_009821 [Opisthorchis felineus]
MNVLWFCCFVKQIRRAGNDNKKISIEPPIKYPWRDNGQLDPNDFKISDKTEGVWGRVPGEIGGQQFLIQDCKNASIYLLDHINTITIDDCDNCTILTGPIRTSIFVRDCKECCIMTACQQFRARDCENIIVFLACATEPIIESSSGMKFGPYQCLYGELDGQFKSAGLSVFNCNWSEIYDFTQDTGAESNFELLGPEEADARKYMLTPKEALENESKKSDSQTVSNEDTVSLLNRLSSVSVSLSPNDSLVPRTLGSSVQLLKRQESCTTAQLNGSALIAVFDHPSANECAKAIVTLLREYPSCYLIRTRFSRFNEYDMERIFGIRAKSKHAKVGAGGVITLEIAGPALVVGRSCEEVVQKASSLLEPGFVHVTSEPSLASRQIDLLNGLYRMHLDTH